MAERPTLKAVTTLLREHRSGSQTRRRAKTIAVHVDADEYATLTVKAQAAGLSAGGFLRAAGLGKQTPRSLPRAPVERELLAKAIGELNRVGNNLNQIARALNRGEAAPHPVLHAALSDYATVIDALLLAAHGKAA
ncbi:MAG: plasmid mobilization relaxosome protein MobC [Acidobacteria bacterium]|nr:plasmid mobilization relaxosome protein MobC [Acidobacteriota bacterium]